MHIQPRVKEGRIKSSASVERQVKSALRKISRDTGASMSWIQNQLMAEALGIEIAADFRALNNRYKLHARLLRRVK